MCDISGSDDGGATWQVPATQKFPRDVILTSVKGAGKLWAMALGSGVVTT